MTRDAHGSRRRCGRTAWPLLIVAVAACSSAQHVFATHDHHRVLHVGHRHLPRRRGAGRRGQGRHHHGPSSPDADQARSHAGRRPRRAGARRRQGGDRRPEPGRRPLRPADPGLPARRRADDGRRRGDPAGPHRGARRVGRGQDPIDASGNRSGPRQHVSSTSVARFIDSTANAMDGNGDKLRQTLAQLSGLGRILADGSGDIVDIIKNLQTFVTALRDSNDQIVQFQDRFATLHQRARRQQLRSRRRADGSVRRGRRGPALRRRHPRQDRRAVQRLANVTQNLVDHRMDWRTSCTSRPTRSPTATTSTTPTSPAPSAPSSSTTSPTRWTSSAGRSAPSRTSPPPRPASCARSTSARHCDC